MLLYSSELQPKHAKAPHPMVQTKVAPYMAWIGMQVADRYGFILRERTKNLFTTGNGFGPDAFAPCGELSRAELQGWVDTFQPKYADLREHRSEAREPAEETPEQDPAFAFIPDPYQYGPEGAAYAIDQLQRATQGTQCLPGTNPTVQSDQRPTSSGGAPHPEGTASAGPSRESPGAGPSQPPKPPKPTVPPEWGSGRGEYVHHSWCNRWAWRDKDPKCKDPNFNHEEYRAWFDKQPPEVQEKLRRKKARNKHKQSNKRPRE